MSKKDFREIAHKIIKTHETSDPFLLAKFLNIQVIKIDFKSWLGLFSSVNGVKTIFINTFDIKPIENESNGTGLDSKLKELLLKLGTYQRTLELILKDEIKDLQSKYNIILENINFDSMNHKTNDLFF